MGFISWIKDKYYDHQLSKADNLVTKGSLDDAKRIYTELLGKQDKSVVHLAKMLTDHADTVQKQINSLKEITDLSQYLTNENRTEYTSELDRHIYRMNSNASTQFSIKSFSSAVALQEAILSVQNNPTYVDRYHRYKAFMYYDESNKNRDFKSKLKAAAEEFKQISSYESNDLHRIDKELVEKYMYVRSIYFLLQFHANESWIKQVIINHIIDVVENKDADIKDIAKISLACTDEDICKEAATEVHTLAISYGNKGDYKNAVRLDNYASEYLTSNNAFTNVRCKHVLEELAPRVQANEISDFLQFIKRSNLNDNQKNAFKERISEITLQAEETKAIQICQLFDKDAVFERIYVDKALSLCKKGGSSLLNKKELQQIIRDITTDKTYPDVLGSFVNYFNSFDLEFYRSAIDRIIEENDMSLLDRYWHIKPNTLFFERLLTVDNSNSSVAISYIVSKSNIFLELEIFRDCFCQKIKSIGNINDTISICEELLSKKCNVNAFYEGLILGIVISKNTEDALSLIDHSLSIIRSKTLIKEKKRLIRVLINEKDFDTAERETQTLEDLDEECWTIYAEILYAKAENSDSKEDKIALFYKVLNLCKEREIYSTFADKETHLLTEISDLTLEYYKIGDKNKAYELCESISHQQEYWLPLFIELCNLELETIDVLSHKIKCVEDCLDIIKNKVDKHFALDNEDYNNLWIQLSNLYTVKSESQPKEKAIESLEHVRTNLRVYCNAKYVGQEDENLTKLIVKLKWNYAIELEQEFAFPKAIEMYTSTTQENVPSYQKRSIMRANICHLKGASVDSEVETSILQNLEEKSYVALREDIAFRYVCYLLKKTRPSEAEALIRKYLPQETELLDICQNIYVKECEQKLEEFNEKIRLIQQNDLSIKEAITFLKEVDRYKEEISKHLTDTSAKFSKYKIQIKAYILKCMFNNESYTEALKTLKTMHPNFIENETAFRNLAVASIGIIESDCNDENILRLAIAIGLSAIYSDKLFVNSLEHTSWDDQFTFTLDSSLGKSDDDDYDDLPDNVNFDEAIDNQNIAIKDVQNNLVIRIETAIRDKHATLEDFYRHEKDSIDKILDLNLDQSFIIASPTLCNELESAKVSIKEALDYEYEQEYGNQEDVLLVGTMYGFSDEIYATYRRASIALNNCKEALEDIHLQNNVQTALSSSRVSAIREFDGLYSQLKSLCSSAMNEAIRAKLEYKKFLDIFEYICNRMNDTSMSLSCANYVNGEIIHRLNEKTMKLRDGIGDMVRIYNLAPTNVQVKENIKGIIQGLAQEAESNYADKTALNKALNNLPDEFKESIALTTIISKLKAEKIAANDALTQIYNLYRSNKGDSEVCMALVALIKVCIHKYVIKDEYESSEVCSILDKLKFNMSPTLKAKASILGIEYFNIMKAIPDENRILLMAGVGLNHKGLCLKKGLDYFKDLGNVDELLKKK